MCTLLCVYIREGRLKKYTLHWVWMMVRFLWWPLGSPELMSFTLMAEIPIVSEK